MTPRRYPDVVASLPHVPHFTAEKPVPLTRMRLDERLARLTPADRAQILRGEALAAWSPEAGLLRFRSDLVGAAEAERAASAKASHRSCIPGCATTSSCAATSGSS